MMKQKKWKVLETEIMQSLGFADPYLSENNDDLEQLCIKPYSAIFDGTLLTSDHRISPKTLDAIQRITKQGIPFTPISARSPLGIWPYAKLIENYNIIVAFSGALILIKTSHLFIRYKLIPLISKPLTKY